MTKRKLIVDQVNGISIIDSDSNGKNGDPCSKTAIVDLDIQTTLNCSHGTLKLKKITKYSSVWMPSTEMDNHIK